MKNFFLLSILTLSFLFVSCAHHRDVRPGTKGVHRVVIQCEDTEEGSQNAIRQANHYCEQFNKTAAFENEDKKYTGDMKEEDYKRGKTISKVVSGVGGAAFVFGGKLESQVGGIAGLGGAIANGALGKGYTVEMRFQCL